MFARTARLRRVQARKYPHRTRPSEPAPQPTAGRVDDDLISEVLVRKVLDEKPREIADALRIDRNRIYRLLRRADEWHEEGRTQGPNRAAREEMARLYALGLPVREIERMLHTSSRMLYRALAEFDVERRPSSRDRAAWCVTKHELGFSVDWMCEFLGVKQSTVRQHLRAAGCDLVDEVVPPGASDEEPLMMQVLRDDLLTTRMDFGNPLRQEIVRMYEAGMTSRDIGDVLGVSPTSLDWHIGRAKRLARSAGERWRTRTEWRRLAALRLRDMGLGSDRVAAEIGVAPSTLEMDYYKPNGKKR